MRAFSKRWSEKKGTSVTNKIVLVYISYACIRTNKKDIKLSDVAM
jgi:hypothetical protein